MPSARLLEHGAGLVDGRVHAGEMRHRGDLLLPLDPVDDRERLLARPAAGAVGDRAEVGVELPQRRDRLLEQRAFALVGPGGEELERHHGPAGDPRGLENVADVVDQAVSSGEYTLATGGILP